MKMEIISNIAMGEITIKITITMKEDIAIIMNRIIIQITRAMLTHTPKMKVKATNITKMQTINKTITNNRISMLHIIKMKVIIILKTKTMNKTIIISKIMNMKRDNVNHIHGRNLLSRIKHTGTIIKKTIITSHTIILTTTKTILKNPTLNKTLNSKCLSKCHPNN